MTRSAKPRFQPWDVVLVPFPYTELNYTKVRPALVVSTETLSAKTGKYFLAMIKFLSFVNAICHSIIILNLLN